MSNSPDEQVNLEQLGENLFKLITSSINDIIVILGPGGRIRYISPSVQRVLGYSVNELVNKSNYKYYHPNDLPIVKARAQRAWQGLPVVATRYEYRFRHRDGDYRWLESETGRILDDTGNTARLLVIARDITAHKLAEQALQDSHDRLALAIDEAKAGVWGFKDASGRIAFRQWWSILGFAEGEVPSTREGWLSLCHPEDLGLIEKTIADYLAGLTTRFELKYRIRHKDGSFRWVLSNGKLVSTRESELPRWAGLIFDITDIKNMEESQRESNRLLRDFAQAIPDGSMIIDERGRYVEVFGHNDQLLPGPREELKGRTLHQILTKRDADFLLATTRQVISDGQPCQFSMELTVKGSRRFTEVRVAPMNYLSGGQRTVAAVFTDVTEKRRTEKLVEFILALRRRSDFIEGMLREKELDSQTVASAKAFGLDPAANFFCCLVHTTPTAGGNESCDADNLPQSGIFELLSNDRQLFVWDYHGDIGIICQADETTSQADSLRTAVGIVDRITAYAPGLQAVAGVGCLQAGLKGIIRSHRQAESAVLVVHSQELPKKVCHFREIGIYKFLANFCDTEQSGEYVRDTLGKLMEYDRRKGTDLLTTLEVILRCGNLREAAQKLFMHYNTAVRNKRRIETILGLSIEDSEIRLALAVAIKLYKLKV
jgi:PAS domain S-box-containing protein